MIITWLWGCLIIFFKGCIGSALVIIGIILILSIGGGFIVLVDKFNPPKKPEKKEPEDWKEWADKQEGDLKSLMTEIDKDLENEEKS
jgi:hypothetical protein